MPNSSLGNDLTAIRHRRGMSMEEIQKITRIPPHILEAIEDDSIFSMLSYSPTYMRSYMRTYAKALGIKEQDIVQALDQVKAGTYDGNLASLSDDEFNDAKDDSSPDGQKNLFIKKKKPYGPKTFLPDDFSSIDWADVGHKAQIPESKRNPWQVIIGVSLLLIALIGIYLLYNYYSSDSNSTPDKTSTKTILKPQAPSDSLKKSLLAEDSTTITRNPTALTQSNALPDTLVLAIYAASGKLEPVRVYTDIEKRTNPYWINKGDTMRFPFVNTIRIKTSDQYNRMQLLFNGHQIKDFYDRFYDSETDMVELGRALFEKNLQWLTPAK